ncbi:MAG: hypothetical protein S0880_25080 [Actinomycetota bacterium]|nr:hypothetical protein [Actinomycetota bacterium]
MERAIRAHDAPCFEPWLEFHERYGGYVEPRRGGDATWGIVHDSPAWLAAGTATIEEAPDDGDWFVRCVDVAPCASLVLDQGGEVVADRNIDSAASFDVRVERVAALWWCTERPGRSMRPKAVDGATGVRLVERVRDEDRIVPEASDHYVTCYLGDDYLAFEDRAHRTFCRLWQG